MKLGDFCDRLGVPYRDARYVLERGVLPDGVSADPGRGEHRDLDPAQAFWLGIVLKLKASGVKVPIAARVADFARDGVRGVAGNLNWEYGFNPFLGRLDTANRWYVDIGDLTSVRIATTANPSYDGLYEFPWSVIGSRRADPHAAPVVVIRLDLARLAALLRG